MSYTQIFPTDLYEIHMDNSDEGYLDIWDENNRGEQTGFFLHFRIIDGKPVAKWIDFTRTPDLVDVDHLNGVFNAYFERIFTLHKKAIEDAVEREWRNEEEYRKEDSRF